MNQTAEPAKKRPTLRIDKWVWHARFAKTRTLAAKLASGGKLRLNGTKVTQPSQPVGVGDSLTLTLNGRIVTCEVLGLGERRGPASEAQTLYRQTGSIKVQP